MNNSTEYNFSIFKEKGRENDPTAPPIRAMKYTENNREHIKKLCDGFDPMMNAVWGEWIIESPKKYVPRTFSVMGQVAFELAYTEIDARGILHGKTCCHD